MKKVFILILIFTLLIGCEKIEKEYKSSPICEIISPEHGDIFFKAEDGTFWNEDSLKLDYTGAMQLKITAKDIDGYIKSVTVKADDKTIDIINQKGEHCYYGVYYFIELRRTLGKHIYAVTVLDNDNLAWQGSIIYYIKEKGLT